MTGGSSMTLRFDPAGLHRLLRSEHGAVGRDLTRRAVAVDRAAKRLAPVDTGRLRASIAWELAQDNRGLLAMIGSDVDYAIYQEFGTSTQRGTPFLRPALRDARR